MARSHPTVVFRRKNVNNSNSGSGGSSAGQRAGRALPHWLRTAITGPRKLVTLGVLLLVAALALAGITVLAPGTPVPTASVSAAKAQHHTPSTPSPSTPSRAATSPAATSPTSPASAAATPPPKAAHAAAAQPPADTAVIQVHRGATLWSLGRRYGTTVAELQALNGLGDSTLIYAGQQLRVPAGRGAANPAIATPATAATATPPIANSGTTDTGTADTSATAATLGAAAKPGSSGYQGIYAFSGDNSSTLVTDPDVAGRSLVYYWGQLEPQPGVYRWDLVDQDMAPWVAAGKKVILRVATAGWTSWDKTADSAHGTPAWVYAQGVKSVTEKDGAVMPQYWNPTFQADLDQFLRAFAARYDGNANVALVDLAVGVGGETKPDSEKNPNLLSLWQSIGYTDPVWWTTVQHVIDSYTQAFAHTPLALMPDKTFLGNTPGYNEAKTLAYAVSKGIWLQDNGLLPGRSLPAPWGQTPVVSEQRNPTTQDGNSLAAELQAATVQHARIILVFTADLTNPADQAVIHQYATQTTGSSGSAGTTGSTNTTCPPLPVLRPSVTTNAIMCPLADTSTTTTGPSGTTPASSPGPATTGRTSATRQKHRSGRSTATKSSGGKSSGGKSTTGTVPITGPVTASG